MNSIPQSVYPFLQERKSNMTIKKFPENARDMWWAQEQASGTVKVLYEDAKNTSEEGALSSTEVSVIPSRNDDVIEVVKKLWYYAHKDEGTWGWPLRSEVEWSHNMTFDEFRDSEWWELYLKNTTGFNFDSSWMDSFSVVGGTEDRYVEAFIKTDKL